MDGATDGTRASGTRTQRAIALLFAPLPGIGHWVVGRGGRGLLAFMVLAAGANLILLSAVVAPVAPMSPTFGWVLAGAAVAFSTIDVARIVLKNRAAASAR